MEPKEKKLSISSVSVKDYETIDSLIQISADKLTAGKILEFVGKLKAEIEQQS
jgi:hypothetical protein